MLKQYKRIKKQRARAQYAAPVILNSEEPGTAINEDATDPSEVDVESDEEEPTKGPCATLWHLKGNLIFMVCICGLTCLYFIITNIQYWVTLYMIDTIKASTSSAQTAFAILCVTGPTAGAVASGPVTKYVGGYESKNALRLAMLLGIVAGVVAFPLALLDNFWLFCIDLWLYLFVGGMLVPLLTGTYLANVEEEYRTTASACGCIFYELFGYAPAPYIYGLVQGATGGKDSRWGLGTTVMANIPAVVLVCIGVSYQSCKAKAKVNG